MKQKNITLFIGIFALIGAALIVFSAANDTGLVVFEAENSETSTAITKTSGDASGGSYISFGQRPVIGPDQCEPYQPLQPTGSGVTYTPMAQAELEAAIGAAQPGDVINLSNDGLYDRIAINGQSSGTAEHPVVIQAAASQQPVVNPNRDNLDIVPAISIFTAQHIMVRGLHPTHGSNGVDVSGSSNITLEHLNITGSGFNAINIDSDKSVLDIVGSPSLIPSTDVLARCNKIHNLVGAWGSHGRGIVVGIRTWAREDGSAPHILDTTNNIRIEHNDIFDIKAAAIAIHEGVTDVFIRDNYVHDITFDDELPLLPNLVEVSIYAVSYPKANVVVERNVFANVGVSDPSLTVKAFLIGHGGVAVRNNVFVNVGNLIIRAQDSFKGEPGVHPTSSYFGWGNPNAELVSFQNNTVWGCETGACFHLGDHTTGTARPQLEYENNLSNNPDAFEGDIWATADDFVGPLNGSADAGSGPGSGFRLKSGSAAIDAGLTLLDFSDDLFQTTRPLGNAWDIGAIESE